MMTSVLKLTVAGVLFLLSALLQTCGVQSASLRQHKLRGGEPEGTRPGPYFMPSTDMVKALEYIESLRQQTQGNERPVMEYDDAERLRALLPLVRQEEAGSDRDEKSQQWLRAVLRTLQHTGKEPKDMAIPAIARYPYSNRQRPKNEDDEEEEDDDTQLSEGTDYESNPWPERAQTHKKYPLMFEDEESRDSPYKRANEDAEEQYTPQSLATLQSVLEELGKLSAPKSHKRHSLDEEQRLLRGGDDDEDVYRGNNLAYEDVVGGEDWTPVEEKVETEEEVKGSRQEFDHENDNVKRSSPEKEDPDDLNKMVDYYVLKILEKTEQSEHKRDRSKDQNADRRAAPASLGINPQAIYQLIEISRKLQIPPEDLIDMLKNGEIKLQDKLEGQEEAEIPDQAEEKMTQVSSYKKEENPNKFYNRKTPEMLVKDVTDDLNTEDILNILGLEGLANQKAKYLLKQRHSKNTPARNFYPNIRGGFNFPENSMSDKRKSEYDDTRDDDELANYLAANMLAQYPRALKKMDLKQASQPSSKEQQLAFETLMQDYFDQMASDKSSPSKRLWDFDEDDDSLHTQSFDDDLNPDNEENQALYGKTAGGM